MILLLRLQYRYTTSLTHCIKHPTNCLAVFPTHYKLGNIVCIAVQHGMAVDCFTGCQIKMASETVVLGQWPHPCEVMQGKGNV